MPLINSWTNWGPLKEVWLGDVYPAEWYDDLAPEIRDIFYHITELTKQDLGVVHRALSELGIVVQRPRYGSRDDYVVDGRLIKPQICPRDSFAVIGNHLYHSMAGLPNPWQHCLDQYQKDPDSHVREMPYLGPGLDHPNGANVVRAGKDVYFDIVTQTLDRTHIKDTMHAAFPEFSSNHRVHMLKNGGHVDGCFAALCPGLLITTKYYTDYQKTFPGWHKINVLEPEFRNHGHRYLHGNGQWHIPGISDIPSFNEHVIKHAQDWVGNYTETFFEVNCLVIDEHNVFMLGENAAVARELERWGMRVHWMPFRTRTFWDGGLHCLTLDVRRDDAAVDVFPERDQPFYCQF